MLSAALSNPVCALWLATFWMLYPSPMVSAVRGNTSRERSVEVSKAFTGGCPGCRISLKVGNDISLAANGSSVLIVAGKKRSPAKPWADAVKGAAKEKSWQAKEASLRREEVLRFTNKSKNRRDGTRHTRNPSRVDKFNEQPSDGLARIPGN